MRRAPVALVAVAIAAAATPALAQSAADVATARDLFREGLRLRDQGKVDEALVKLRAAHDLYDTPPSSLELARTLAMKGELAEAEETANAVRRIPASSKESAHSRAARAEAQKLATDLHARVPTLTITAAGAVDGVTLTLDGEPMPSSLLGIARRLDPGEHTVVAKTPRGQVVTRKVTLAERDAKTLELEIPADTETRSVPGGVVSGKATSGEAERARKFGVLYKFVTPVAPEAKAGDVWTLRDASGGLVCTMPCEKWLTDPAGLVMVRKRGGAERAVEVPGGMLFPAGLVLTVRPHAGKGVAALNVLGGVLGALGFIGLLVGVPILVVGLVDKSSSAGDILTAGLVTTIASGTSLGVGLALGLTNAPDRADVAPTGAVVPAPLPAARTAGLRVTF